jgi:serine/threonine protein kinase
MFAPGEQFKEYFVHEIMGETPRTTTLLAESPQKEMVVVKVFKETVFTRDEGFDHLKRPRKAIADGVISNDTYLAFYRKVAMEETASGERHAYLVRGYVRGENLDSWKTQSRTLAEIKVVMRKICLGLDHLHKAGLIHGGLCPRNVILGGDVLKLTDFGTGAGFLSSVLGLECQDPQVRPFLPPWHDDPEKLQSPATDIYALGVLLSLLETGTLPEGIPEDASSPVRKAMGGGYGNVDELLADVEQLGVDEEDEEEAERAEKYAPESEGPEAYEDSEGSESERREEIPEGSAPEVAPHVEVTGEGIKVDPSGLVYRVRKQFRRKGTASFFLKNLETSGKEITVRADVLSGSDWMRIEPGEIRVPPGEQRFDIFFGPIPSPGAFVGKIVLEISLDGVNITRDILIEAECKRRLLALPPWWKWATAASCAALLVVFAASTQYVSFSGIPRGMTAKAPVVAPPDPLPPTTPSPVASQSPGDPSPSVPPIAITPTLSVPPSPGIDDQLALVRRELLAKGEYLDAVRKLGELKSAFPENQEVNLLFDQMGRKLSVKIDLLASPGQGALQGNMQAIASGGGFQLKFTPDDDCYLYIYQMDSHNKLDRLFPNPKAHSLGGYVQADNNYIVPSAGDYFVLDSNVGQETIYFVASRWPAKDLEELHAKLDNSSDDLQKAAYQGELLDRVRARGKAIAAGVSGCFYTEYAFRHVER